MLKKLTNKYIQGSQSYLLFDDQVHDDFKKIEESHRGVGKTRFLCRLMLHYVTEECRNVVMTFKTKEHIDRYLRYHLLRAVSIHPKLRYRKKSDFEIIICESYNIDVSVRKPDISIRLGTSNFETRDEMTRRLQWYEMNDYRMMQHDSVLVDMRMVRELKILKEPDERLPLYVGYKWYWELLHKDYLGRLKNIQSFATAV